MADNTEFFARLRPAESGCLEYFGPRMKGYGTCRGGKRKKLAHRISWELAHGPIPDGMFVCHKCDNPACVNVEHLFLGDQAANMLDCILKDRVYRPKLIPNEVRALRSIAAEGRFTQRQIAKLFGVTQTTIHNILSRKQWQHVN